MNNRVSLNNADCHLLHTPPSLMVLDIPSFLLTHPPLLSLNSYFFLSSHRFQCSFQSQRLKRLPEYPKQSFFFFFPLVATLPDVDRGDPDYVRGLTITVLKESDNFTSVSMLLLSKTGSFAYLLLPRGRTQMLLMCFPMLGHARMSLQNHEEKKKRLIPFRCFYLEHVRDVGSQIFSTVKKSVRPFYLNSFTHFWRTPIYTVSTLKTQKRTVLEPQKKNI